MRRPCRGATLATRPRSGVVASLRRRLPYGAPAGAQDGAAAGAQDGAHAGAQDGAHAGAQDGAPPARDGGLFTVTKGQLLQRNLD